MWCSAHCKFMQELGKKRLLTVEPLQTGKKPIGRVKFSRLLVEVISTSRLVAARHTGFRRALD